MLGSSEAGRIHSCNKDITEFSGKENVSPRDHILEFSDFSTEYGLGIGTRRDVDEVEDIQKFGRFLKGRCWK